MLGCFLIFSKIFFLEGTNFINENCEIKFVMGYYLIQSNTDWFIQEHLSEFFNLF